MPKTIVVTGASNGIGAAAARRLSRDGHRLVIVGRSAERTSAIAREIGADFYLADFASLDEVRTLAGELDRYYSEIGVLANNAGGIYGDRVRTVDGFELTFQVNHLAPFLLTTLLIDKLIASRASVIQTSSLAARLLGRVDFDDLEHDGGFSPQLAYGTTKLENILFTKELDRRYRDQGISAAAFHPGIVATGFSAGSDSFVRHIYNNPLGRLFMTSPDKGAEQLVWLAETAAGTEWTSGTYYERYRPARRLHRQANDQALAQRLWDVSVELLATQPS